ncbi:N-acetyl-gamma-glutamyl-phosphate reductase [Falsibacillus albus]|uniref:N-acetyl-gamma-glutamyl-phosphate reductase n=1 Tax=Falsibacillus albus TaxID=2478915 RepID=A0A3L7JZC8_9BACI|nr:N-acetyl-gamma-glutamyl-phosphate reductase [Falsibacillus albus]RLQ96076.1 N-acetyl-gamma-glutamyl-phosphate reductase [Falsibacillus albus]
MKAGIIGATGYSGIELVRLLHFHPNVDLVKIISNSKNGEEISEVFPHLSNIFQLELSTLDIDELAKGVDLIFLAVPSGISKKILPVFMEKEIKCVDLSGDFRLKNPEDYEKWYGGRTADKHYLTQATYGLSEIFKEDIRNAHYIANPGCYPTAALLGLIPALKNGIIDKDSIIIDGKSGASGAGRKAATATLFAEINENVKAYKLGKHQHIPEIEQILGKVSSEIINITFTTHLLPITRGIMCTMYTKLQGTTSEEKVIDLYKAFYEETEFIRIRDAGRIPAIKEVSGSNYCDIGFAIDERTGTLVIVSCIDNILKGAAGQAIQNMNLMMGWDESLGLTAAPSYP